MKRPPAHVLVTGASGLLGTALMERLPGEGYRPFRLERKKGDAKPEGASWDPPAGKIVLDPALPLRSVIHLAGAGIADKLWTEKRKKLLRESRVDATHGLATALAALPPESRPESLIMASGIGIYGDRGKEVLTEESSDGTGFLAELARDWEDAADPAREAGIRVVSVRLGMVLSPAGGALAKMLTPFRLGLGGRIGSGLQGVSWIALPDAVGIFLMLVGREDVSGPINGVSTGFTTQRAFADCLGRAVRRPTVLPLPSFAVKAMFGEMGREILLAGQRVEPTRLLALKVQNMELDYQSGGD